MTQQLAFNLPAHPAQGLDDFLMTPSNGVALSAIQAWQNWPNRKLVLVGANGTGKTHLCHVWSSLVQMESQTSAQHAKQTSPQVQIIEASSLDIQDIPSLSGRSVAIENAQKIAGDSALETALFHLHNLVLADGGSLLLTANTPPSRWNLELRDLNSRMQATTIAQLERPDDMLLSAVLVKLFDDRQVSVPLNLINYLLPRMERSLGAAAKMVERLDHAALAQGRPLTRSLAARLLGDAGGDFGGNDSKDIKQG